MLMELKVWILSRIAFFCTSQLRWFENIEQKFFVFSVGGKKLFVFGWIVFVLDTPFRNHRKRYQKSALFCFILLRFIIPYFLRSTPLHPKQNKTIDSTDTNGLQSAAEHLVWNHNNWQHNIMLTFATAMRYGSHSLIQHKWPHFHTICVRNVRIDADREKTIWCIFADFPI